jgi:hypothetical protein
MTIGTFIQNYWEMIVFFIGLFITWWRISIKFAIKQANDDEKIKDIVLRTTKVEARVDAVFPDINTIKTDVAVMKNTLEFIKGSITQISSGTIQIQK